MIAPKKEKRQVPMQVLSLGFARTGTASMKAALELLLGQPCYHAFELLDNVEHTTTWNRALDAKFFNKGTPLTTPEQWDTILSPYAAVTDFPSIVFADELMTAYPDAKVILVQRDLEKWYVSFDTSVSAHFFGRMENIAATLDPWWLGRLAKMHLRWVVGFFEAEDLETMRANSRRVYLEHYEHVRKITPKEKLLEYELGSGWEPLCEFLGIEEVPTVPFPRVNESAAMEAKVQGIMKETFAGAARRALVCGGPIVVALGAWWWFGSD